ncbi:hypothetical protein [Janthinobacterium sp.]|uniref:hypothetical protein n=1 Tax=Janthinobacterium sp. TaxID=1871054 RepID=UPI0025829DA0|nr:hypothetical protein [Janthinobacterium sp.]MCX7289567.1 hypothetical protein [Janthinobacterium sp.]
MDSLCERESFSQARGSASQSIPENVRLQTPGSFCAKDEKLGWAFARWRIRFDFEWLREVAQLSAVGQDKAALQILDDKDQLKLVSAHTATVDAMTCDWEADRRVIEQKTMIDFRHIYGNIHSLLNNQTIFWCVLKASIRLACQQCSRFHIAYTEDTRI